MNRDYYIPHSWGYARLPETVAPARARFIASTFRTFHSWERLMQNPGKPSKHTVKSGAHKRGGLVTGRFKESFLVIPAGSLPANARSRTIARYDSRGRLIKKVRAYRGPRNVKKKDPFRTVKAKEKVFTDPEAIAVRTEYKLPLTIDGSVFMNTYVYKAKVKATLPKENLSQWDLR